NIWPKSWKGPFPAFPSISSRRRRFSGWCRKARGTRVPRADPWRKLRRPDFPPSLPGKAGRALLEESRDPFQEIPGFARLRLSPGFRFEGGGQVFFKAARHQSLGERQGLGGRLGQATG